MSYQPPCHSSIYIRRKLLAQQIINDTEGTNQTSYFNGAPEDEDWRVFKPRIDDDGTAYESLRNLAKLRCDDYVLIPAG